MTDKNPTRRSIEDESTRTARGELTPTSQRQIGPYRLLQRVGEGGMGEVWEAEQEKPIRRRVALKLIKLGLDSKEVIARFESERQALALMSHPGVAKVFDAGTTDSGRPYFVMEFVKGLSITAYCDRNRLTTRERLALFEQTCEAIHHAHQRGIIHRDIKPSNILVEIQEGKPQVKVIDFGVAKAIHQRLTDKTLHTQLGRLVGTLAYMSPEQADLDVLDIDTTTDVYSLGVLLYELLTGYLPFEAKRLRQAGYAEMQRILREEEPPRPSTKVSTAGETSTAHAEHRRLDTTALVRRLRGDLDWITLKALDKDRTRRYGSASELGADVARHLRHEPVAAGPPGTGYRLAKFVRRNRLAVLAASAVLVALVLGASVAVWQAVRATRAEGAMRQEAETATATSDFLVDLFRVSDPSEAQGNTITAREILDRGAERLREDLGDEPLVRARLMGTIASVYFGLGLFNTAAPLAEDALSAREDLLDPDHLDVASSLGTLGIIYTKQGKYEEAEPLIKRALEIRERVHGPEHSDVASSLSNLSIIYARQGKFAEAEPLFKRSLEIRERVHGPDHVEVARSLNNLANVYRRQRKFEEAEPLYKRSLEMKEKTLGVDHPDVAGSLGNLGLLYLNQGNLEDAEALLKRSLEIKEKTLGPDHNLVATTLTNLAEIYRRQGKYEDAEPLLKRSLEIKERALGPDHLSVADSLHGLGSLYRDQQRFADAESLFKRALEIREKALGPDHADVATMLAALATLYRRQGNLEDAEPLLKRALEIQEKARGPDRRAVAVVLTNLAENYRRQGNLEDAEPLFKRSLEIRERVLGPEDLLVASPLHGLGAVYRDQQRFADAESLFKRALAIREKTLEPDHPDLVRLRDSYAVLLRATGRDEEADALTAVPTD